MSSTSTGTTAATAGPPIPAVLSIAGSDSGGGAGIQADLKAFARCGVHGMTAITAITVQNTIAVSAVHHIPADTILGQVRAIVEDIGVSAVKVGMLGTRETIQAVAQALSELPRGTPVVVDPVMVAESGARLLAQDAQESLIAEILPLTTVLTPNLPEAQVLAGDTLGTSEAAELARTILGRGPQVVVLTGGHRDRATDLFLDSQGTDGPVELAGRRHPDGAAHGSGCTHSSVLAAQLALGRSPLEAARIARTLAGEAVGQGLREIGRGAGPVDVIGLRERRGQGPVGGRDSY